VVVCYRTAEYRQAATTNARAADIVLEIGCHAGGAPRTAPCTVSWLCSSRMGVPLQCCTITTAITCTMVIVIMHGCCCLSSSLCIRCDHPHDEQAHCLGGWHRPHAQRDGRGSGKVDAQHWRLHARGLHPGLSVGVMLRVAVRCCMANHGTACLADKDGAA
jgi:hypothetical protein